MNPNHRSDDSAEVSGHDDPLESDDFHQGYDLETGMLVRAHEWIDLFPALRLIRVLRVAGSPPLLMLTALVLSLWFAGGQMILAISSPSVDPSERVVAGEGSAEGEMALPIVSEPLSLWTPGLAGTVPWSLGGRIACAIWSILVWSPIALLLARQGALLTAQRPMMSLGSAARLALRRTPASWLTALVPCLCLIPFAFAVWLAGWITAWSPDFQPLHVVSGIVIGVFAVLAGVLAFGALFAVPISWAALVNEREADPLDSLSRGYEYFLRRPVQLVLKLMFSVALLAILAALAIGVAIAGSGFAQSLLAAAGASSDATETAVHVVRLVPLVVIATLGWSLLGGIYLLLRYDAGRQEVEDLWETPTIDRPPLPDLPRSDLG